MTSYILGESQGETRRLITQAKNDPIGEIAHWAGLKQGMHVIDAGCGPGVLSHELAHLVGESGSVRGFDQSSARIDVARSHPGLPGSGPVTFEVGDIYAPPFPAQSADFVLCEFVFEYLSEPARAIAALSKLLRPGGVLLLRDVDGNGQTIWPLPEAVEQSLPKMFSAMARTGFDAYSGRKLYRWMHDGGFVGLDARVDSRVTAGRAPPDEIFAWEVRLDALKPLGAQAFGSPEAYQAAADAYLAMLRDDGTFRYLNNVSVRGIRP